MLLRLAILVYPLCSLRLIVYSPDITENISYNIGAAPHPEAFIEVIRPSTSIGSVYRSKQRESTTYRISNILVSKLTEIVTKNKI